MQEVTELSDVYFGDCYKFVEGKERQELFDKALQNYKEFWSGLRRKPSHRLPEPVGEKPLFAVSDRGVMPTATLFRWIAELMGQQERTETDELRARYGMSMPKDEMSRYLLMSDRKIEYALLMSMRDLWTAGLN